MSLLLFSATKATESMNIFGRAQEMTQDRDPEDRSRPSSIGFSPNQIVLDEPGRLSGLESRMTAKIYGIKNCDTMKKAFTWLDGHGVSYTFHDYRAQGIDARTIKDWVEALGWEKVLNKASTTFKELPDADKAGLDEAKAIALMAKNPTMIKRPMLVTGKTTMAGFKPDLYNQTFLG